MLQASFVYKINSLKITKSKQAWADLCQDQVKLAKPASQIILANYFCYLFILLYSVCHKLIWGCLQFTGWYRSDNKTSSVQLISNRPLELSLAYCFVISVWFPFLHIVQFPLCKLKHNTLWDIVWIKLKLLLLALK